MMDAIYEELLAHSKFLLWEQLHDCSITLAFGIYMIKSRIVETDLACQVADVGSTHPKTPYS